MVIRHCWIGEAVRKSSILEQEDVSERETTD